MSQIKRERDDDIPAILLQRPQAELDESDDDKPLPRKVHSIARLSKTDDSDDDKPLPRKVQSFTAQLSKADDSDDDAPLPPLKKPVYKNAAEKFIVERMAILQREADAREAKAVTLKHEADAKAVAERADFFISNPGIKEEYMFMVNNFYTGDLKKNDEGVKRTMQYMVNVRSDPRNLRNETVDRHAAVRIAIPKYLSAVHFVEAYMYLNMHKYPSFYEHMNADQQKMTLTSTRLCSFFSGDRTNIERSFSSYRRYAGLLYYMRKLEAEIEAGAASLYSTANTVSYMISTSINLVDSANQFNIVFYPEITLESVQQYLANDVFPAIGKVHDESDLRKRFCGAIADYAEEAYYDGDTAVLKALQAMLHNVMQVQESTIQRRLHAVLTRQVVNADD